MAARGLRGLLLLCLIGHALWAALEPVTAADLWVALASGRWIVEHGTVPSVDVFSYTRDGAPWFNQEWLSQVVFYWLYETTGGIGVAVLKIALVLSAFGLATWIATLQSGSFTLAVLCSCAAAFVCRPFLDIRPQIFTFPAALLVLGILHVYRRGAPAAILAVVPLVVALWVNLHYGFIYGIGMCFLFAGTEAFASLTGVSDTSLPPRRLVPLAAVSVLTLLVALLNPQGPHALTFPFTIVTTQSAWREVIEWTPPTLFAAGPFSPISFSYFLLAQAVTFVLVLVAAPRRIDPSLSLLVAVTAAMALTSRRFIPLFALISVPSLARNLALLGERLQSFAMPARAALAGTVALLATGHIGWRLAPEISRNAAGLFEETTRIAYFPSGATEFLRLNPLPGWLFNLYTWSGYVLFQVPGQRVLIDGRAHQVYPQELWLESFAVEMGHPEWETILSKYEVSIVLWPSDLTADEGFKTLLHQLRESPSWIRIYDDGQATIFAHVERGRTWVDAYRTLGLHYPDIEDAQLFLGEAMLAAGEFDRAREHFLGAFSRHPHMREFFRTILIERLGERARTTNDPSVWFQVGFVRDLLEDRAAAAEGYRTALAAGIPEPLASFAAQALVRLDAGN